jgi:hypothetical protein
VTIKPNKYTGGRFRPIPPGGAALVNLPRKSKKPVRWAGEISTTKRQLKRLARKANHEHR